MRSELPASAYAHQGLGRTNRPAWRTGIVTEAKTLEQLLDQIDDLREDSDRVSVDQILDAVGRRSFGPLLLVAGLTVLAPLVGDIPGVPTVIGLFVAILAAQLLVGRDHLWLPGWMLNRSAASGKLEKPLGWLRKGARFADRLFRRRLTMLTRGTGQRVVAAICLLVAAVMPIMEVVPFSANLAGLILTSFGFALIARDGLMALIGAVVTIGTMVLIVVVLF